MVIGYLRSGEDDFPALKKLTNDSVFETELYLELVSLFAAQGKLLTIMPELMIDHVLREQSYYLLQLGVQVPPLPEF